jgi:hypothetical protein
MVKIAGCSGSIAVGDVWASVNGARAHAVSTVPSQDGKSRCSFETFISHFCEKLVRRGHRKKAIIQSSEVCTDTWFCYWAASNLRPIVPWLQDRLDARAAAAEAEAARAEALKAEAAEADPPQSERDAAPAHTNQPAAICNGHIAACSEPLDNAQCKGQCLSPTGVLVAELPSNHADDSPKAQEKGREEAPSPVPLAELIAAYWRGSTGAQYTTPSSGNGTGLPAAQAATPRLSTAVTGELVNGRAPGTSWVGRGRYLDDLLFAGKGSPPSRMHLVQFLSHMNHSQLFCLYSL